MSAWKMMWMLPLSTRHEPVVIVTHGTQRRVAVTTSQMGLFDASEATSTYVT